MKLVVDVYYFGDKAKIVGLLFENWEDKQPYRIISFYKDGIADYESGQFYKRELPCVKELLMRLDLSLIDIIILDSFVYLDNEKKLGLGGYVYECLRYKIPVIGVAKTPFLNNELNVVKVFRGKSHRPLYVSAAGIDLKEAAVYIQSMNGYYRFPTMLKLLDTKTKELNDI